MLLLLELGIWLLPFTLIFAPLRRLVRLVANLQQICDQIVSGRGLSLPSRAIWGRLERLDSATVMIS
ncbi:hypothetical protein ACMD2_20045 [Ananas comosus]|uniref:Uncharacterized protein n=1 Tax=Ananas comosus TaxID=4615 RepID=A0A199VQ33_ANACO|nr:hypothetical protein ACMD2_20045 [Ananas comosus]